jgi:hypothetical protein
MIVAYVLAQKENPGKPEAPKKYCAQAKSERGLIFHKLSREIVEKSLAVVGKPLAVVDKSLATVGRFLAAIGKLPVAGKLSNKYAINDILVRYI